MTQQEYYQYLKEHPCEGNCPYHNGSDCTRDPYEEGCIDPVVEQYWKEHQNNTEGR